ncbi:MAG: hypothetical protein IJA94_02185 [Bacilli bacterium]|nr:hypothetical protein [Bacilli bacterium]
MLKNADKELIEYIKNSENVSVTMINDIRNAYFLKLQENHIKSLILDWLPQTKYIEKLIANIFDERDYWQTVVGYWLFKKLKEEFPNFDFYLPDEEPKLIDYVIVQKMQATILAGESKVLDVVSIWNDISVVKETKRLVNAPGSLRLKDIEGSFITEEDYHTINKLLNNLNENQRLKNESAVATKVKYANPKGTRIYSNDSNTLPLFRHYSVDVLYLINGKDPIRMFALADDYVIEEKNFDSIVNNEKKRAKEAIKRERLNKSFKERRNN